LVSQSLNYARFLGVNPEDALEKDKTKFIKRFSNNLEVESAKDGKVIPGDNDIGRNGLNIGNKSKTLIKHRNLWQ